jgi:hypothetical protein
MRHVSGDHPTIEGFAYACDEQECHTWMPQNEGQKVESLAAHLPVGPSPYNEERD